MTDAAADPFASGANPFDAIGYSDGMAKMPGASDPFAGGANPFEKIGKVDEASQSSAGTSTKSISSDIGKSLTSGTVQGVLGLASIPGDMMRAVNSIGSKAAAHIRRDWIGDETGAQKIEEKAQKSAEKLDEMVQYIPGLQSTAQLAGRLHPYAPSDYIDPIYQPQTTAGKFSQAIGRAVPSVIGGPGSLTAKVGATVGMGVGGEAAREVAEGTPYEVPAEIAGSIIGGAGPAGIAAGSRAVSKLVPPVTAAGRNAAAQATVGREIATAGGGASAVREAVDANPNMIPGSEGTLAQRAPALAQWEDAVRTQNRAPFIERAADQNAARVAHLQGVQPEGDIHALPEGLRGQLTATDTATAGAIDKARQGAEAGKALADTVTAGRVAGAQAEQASALDALRNPPSMGSPADTAAHFRAVRDALASDADAAVERAQGQVNAARAGAAPAAQNFEQAGQAARGPLADALAARKAADSALYDAAKIPDNATVPAAPITKAVAEVNAGLTPESKPLGGEEKRLFDLAGSYGDEIPFNRLKDLRSSILDESAATRRNDPAAYRRLQILRGAVEDAMDHAAERHAALDEVAVRRGLMAPEDTILANVGKFVDERAGQNTGLAEDRVAAGSSSGGRAPADAGMDTVASEANGGPAGAESPAGIRPRAGAESGAAAAAGIATREPVMAPRPSPVRTYHAAYEDFSQPDFSRLGKTTIGNVKGTSIEPWAMNLAKAGFWSSADDVAKRMAAPISIPFDLSGKVKTYPSLDAMERAIRKAGGPDAYREKMISDGFSHAKVSDEEFNTTSYVTFDPSGIRKASPEPPTVSKGGAEQPKPSTQPVTPEQVAALKTANASYREQRETFGDGPIGDLLEKKPRGADFRLSDADVPRKIFHPGPSGGEDVRAYIKAVGPEKATPVLNDLAAFMLHEKGFDAGVPDPAKIGKWLDDHKSALAELPPETRAKFQTVGDAQRAVDDALAARRERLGEFDKSAAARIAGLEKPSDIVDTVGGILGRADGAKSMGELAAKAAGNPAAESGLKQAVVEHVLNKFVPDVSAPRVGAMRDFLSGNAETLKAAGLSDAEIKALDARASRVATAGEGVKTAEGARASALKTADAQGKAAVQAAEGARADAMSKFETGIVRRLVHAESDSDVLSAVRSMFEGANSTARMSALAKEAAGVQGGSDALKKAITQMIERRFQGVTEAGSTGVNQLNAGQFQKFMRSNVETLKAAGLSDEQVGKLSAIVRDQQRSARSINNAKLSGQSNTTPDMLNAAKDGSILNLVSHGNEELLGAVAGHAFHGLMGTIGGILGAKVFAALREAGLTRLNDIRVQAALNPDFAKALLEKVPDRPDRGAAALVALRARQMAIVGANASARENGREPGEKSQAGNGESPH